MKISICIPTYNRAKHLANCLNSIRVAINNTSGDFEVCVSDNCSTDNTSEVVHHAQLSMPIKYCKNQENLGIPRNFINVVRMADGEFAWLVGDDDILLPDSLARLSILIDKHSTVDFFYVNAFHLDTDYIFSFKQPFDTKNLPLNMQLFSQRPNSGELPFLDLVDPEVSFDFLGGMFLSVFRRQKWIENTNKLDSIALQDSRIFSHFDNTFPHVKIFAKAFSNSSAYFNSSPMIVCLTGAREWAPMYPLVRSIRIIEALVEYRKSGLTFFKYYRCRNFALRNFLPDMARMFLNPRKSGLEYVVFNRMLLSNLLYPNFYLSPLIYVLQRLRLVKAM
jgi:glycosyltransferase involved in cell wall biosynthesis